MLIAICGQSGVGKTTICNALECEGYLVISASYIASQMYASERGRAPSRLDLAEFGTEILSSTREAEFLHRLLAELPESGNVVLDGLRSVLALDHLRDNYQAIIVLMVGRQAASPSGGDTGSVYAVELSRVSAEVDAHIRPGRFEFDLVVSNDGPVVDTCAAVREGITEIARRRRTGC